MRAAIFDMDGTLVSTLDIHLQAYLNVGKNHGLGIERDFVKMRFGMTAFEIFKGHIEQKGLEADCKALAEEKFEEFNKLAQEVPILPGVIDVLERLKAGGIGLGLASGSGRKNVDVVMEKTGLGRFFEVTVAGDEVPRGKEFPDIWFRALELLQGPQEPQIQPAECVVFEDAFYGAQSAKQAGMVVVGVLTGHTTSEELEPICDFVLNDLTEFQNVLDKI